MKTFKCKKSCQSILILIVLIMSLLTGCGVDSKNETDSVTKSLNSDNFTINDEYIEIPCEYGVLKYPAKWKELLSVEYGNDKQQDIITLFYCDDAQKAELAHITFGETNGFLVGTINDINVSVTLCDIEGDEWSESDILNYCAMLEDINELISHLNELEGFKSQ